MKSVDLMKRIPYYYLNLHMLKLCSRFYSEKNKVLLFPDSRTLESIKVMTNGMNNWCMDDALAG